MNSEKELQEQLNEIQTARDEIQAALEAQGETPSNDIRTFATTISNLSNIKSVNNEVPDENGNVQLDASKINIDETATTKKTLKEAVEELNTTISTTSTEVDTKASTEELDTVKSNLEAGINTNNDKIEEVKVNVTTLENLVDTNTQAIVDNKTAVDTEIASLEAKDTELETALDTKLNKDFATGVTYETGQISNTLLTKLYTNHATSNYGVSLSLDILGFNPNTEESYSNLSRTLVEFTNGFKKIGQSTEPRDELGSSNFIPNMAVDTETADFAPETSGITSTKLSPAIRELKGLIDTNTEAIANVEIPEYTIAESTVTEGYSKSYALTKDGVETGLKIDIPKDLVISSGTVKVVTAKDTPYTGAVVGDKYLDLVLNDSAEDHIYIPVKDLVDVYTGIDGNKIKVAINDANEIEATIKAGTIEKADLTSALQTEISGKANQTDLNSLQTKVNGLSNYDDTEIKKDITDLETLVNTNTTNISKKANQTDLNSLQTKVDTNTTDITNLTTTVGNKVDKVTGKGLSTNDFTTTEKNKLASLSNYDDTEVKADITALEKSVSTNTTNISKKANQTDLDALETTVAGLKNYDDTAVKASIKTNTDNIASLTTKVNTNTTNISNKVDKVSGKGLSTNDYTTAEKNKLAGLSNYDDTTITAGLVNKLDKGFVGEVITNPSGTTETKTTRVLLSNKAKWNTSNGMRLDLYTTELDPESGSVSHYEVPLVIFSTGFKSTGTSSSGGSVAHDLAIDSSTLKVGATGKTLDGLNTEVGNKVDKVSGKGLSTNDYTTAEKNKLAGLSNYNDTTIKADIKTNTDSIASLTTKVNTNTTNISNKVDKVSGKGLSTNDYTTTEKNKLAGLSNYDDTTVKADIATNKTNIATNTTNIANLTPRITTAETNITNLTTRTTNIENNYATKDYAENVINEYFADPSEIVVTENHTGTYYFTKSNDVYTSNNQNVQSSTAESTFTIPSSYANTDMQIKWTVSSENNYDKFTLKVGDEVKVDAVSGTKSGFIIINIPVSTKITATYIKDNSSNVGNDSATVQFLTVSNKDWLSTVDNPAEIYEPLYDGSPTTKKYVDTQIDLKTSSIKSLTSMYSTVLGGWHMYSDGDNLTEMVGFTNEDYDNLEVGTILEYPSTVDSNSSVESMITYISNGSSYKSAGGRYYYKIIVTTNQTYELSCDVLNTGNVYKGTTLDEVSGGGIVCFTADTLVSTPDGLRRISEIELGDSVNSFNEETKQVEVKTVDKLLSHLTNKIYKISVGNDIIETTYSHPFFTLEKGKCIAQNLKVGDTLRTIDNRLVQITGIEIVEQPDTPVYEMRVTDNHNYYVGNTSILVFNEEYVIKDNG